MGEPIKCSKVQLRTSYVHSFMQHQGSFECVCGTASTDSEKSNTKKGKKSKLLFYVYNMLPKLSFYQRKWDKSKHYISFLFLQMVASIYYNERGYNSIESFFL